eukprot:1017307-Prymnesium_polylepis.1
MEINTITTTGGAHNVRLRRRTRPSREHRHPAGGCGYDQLDAQQSLDSHREIPETRTLEKIKGSAALLGEA